MTINRNTLISCENKAVQFKEKIESIKSLHEFWTASQEEASLNGPFWNEVLEINENGKTYLTSKILYETVAMMHLNVFVRNTTYRNTATDRNTENEGNCKNYSMRQAVNDTTKYQIIVCLDSYELPKSKQLQESLELLLSHFHNPYQQKCWTVFDKEDEKVIRFELSRKGVHKHWPDFACGLETHLREHFSTAFKALGFNDVMIKMWQEKSYYQHGRNQGCFRDPYSVRFVVDISDKQFADSLYALAEKYQEKLKALGGKAVTTLLKQAITSARQDNMTLDLGKHIASFFVQSRKEVLPMLRANKACNTALSQEEKDYLKPTFC